MKTEKEMRECAKASAAYWLDCSEHEQTPEDAKILARYARLAIDRIVELEAAELRAAQAGTPIEKAARAILTEMDTFGSRVLSGKMSDESIGGAAPIIIGAWADRLRASLSSLPQEPAPGDRCQSCGWKDEDHSEAGGIPVCPNLPPETLWQEIEGVCDALPECPDKIIPGLAAAVDANVKAGMEWMRRAESQAGAQEPKEGGDRG